MAKRGFGLIYKTDKEWDYIQHKKMNFISSSPPKPGSRIEIWLF
jgi:hypothetical protein